MKVLWKYITALFSWPISPLLLTAHKLLETVVAVLLQAGCPQLSATTNSVKALKNIGMVNKLQNYLSKSLEQFLRNSLPKYKKKSFSRLDYTETTYKMLTMTFFKCCPRQMKAGLLR